MKGIDFRLAKNEDLASIVELINNDYLERSGELNNYSIYKKAFDEIMSTQNNYLFVMTKNNNIIGTFHITIMPAMPLRGSKRMNIESVRIAKNCRGMGYGSFMVKFAVEFARSKGCQVCQLTTNVLRSDTKRFYVNNGFEATHIGMKLMLT